MLFKLIGVICIIFIITLQLYKYNCCQNFNIKETTKLNIQ